MECLQEPDIKKASKPEDTFKKAILEVLMKCLNAKKDSGTIAEYLTLENFGLDIAVFIKLNNGQCIARFFNVDTLMGDAKAKKWSDLIEAIEEFLG